MDFPTEYPDNPISRHFIVGRKVMNPNTAEICTEYWHDDGRWIENNKSARRWPYDMMGENQEIEDIIAKQDEEGNLCAEYVIMVQKDPPSRLGGE